MTHNRTNESYRKIVVRMLVFTPVLYLLVNCTVDFGNSVNSSMIIELPDSSKVELDGYIEHAKSLRVIPEEDKKYVKAYILKGNQKVKIKMRLKGDWTDHLTYGYPSYRIKIKGEYHFHHLKEFSIQHPKTRNYLHEWILHRIAEEEDILTTKYGFETVQIGEDIYEAYAYEEHFAKQLVERRNRREGPILKMDESTTWDFLAQGFEQEVMDDFPYFEASRVSVFKKNKTTSNPGLFSAFNEGKKLLRHFKEGTAKLEDIFDLDQLAKFYVLMELSGSNHGLRWHNRRFYYNPITQKLEHIAYDLVPFNNHEDFEVQFLERRMKNGAIMLPFNFDAQVFLNPTFKIYYQLHMERMTSEAYYQNMLTKLWPDLVNYHHELTRAHENYSFDGTVYKDRIRFLRNNFSAVEDFWNSVLEKRSDPTYWQREIVYQPRKDTLFAPSISLNAYLTPLDTGYQLIVRNYHVNDIEWLGYTVKGVEDTLFFKRPYYLAGYKNFAVVDTMFANLKPHKLIYRVTNETDGLREMKVLKWSMPEGNTARMNLTNRFNSQSSLFEIKENQLIFHENVKLNHLLLIPSNYNVVIQPGIQIELEGEGGLIICGSLKAVGTEENPINIVGLSPSNNGLVVLNGRYAWMEYVKLDSLSNLDYKNWTLTGGLSIHETPTYLSHVSVAHNSCEDAINLIRCSFIAQNIRVSHTFSDGIDMDFCRGRLSDVQLDHTGNDGVDFSGSYIELINVEMIEVGDKGVSGGEKSTIKMENISIKNAITGVASKDASLVFGQDVSVESAEFGVAAFCKKDEYGPAIMDIANFREVEVKASSLLDKGSIVILNDAEDVGQEQLNIDSLYAPFEK